MIEESSSSKEQTETGENINRTYMPSPAADLPHESLSVTEHVSSPITPQEASTNNNNNTLSVPNPSHTRRKRGLSLRSQLFNKAFNIHQEKTPLDSDHSTAASKPLDNIELQPISDRVHTAPPQINIDESPDPLPVYESSSSLPTNTSLIMCWNLI